MDFLQLFKKHLLQDKKRHSRATVKNYLADVKKFIEWFEQTFHREYIPSLVTKDLVAVYRHQIAQPNEYNYVPAAASVKRYLSSLRNFYSFLVSKNIATANPFEIEESKPQPLVD